MIGNKEVGDLYIQIIESLGVEISPLKTHKSSVLLEFAKRWIYKGVEVTPFPISALRECGSRYYLLTNLLLETSNKGWVTESIPVMVEDFMGRFLNMSSTRRTYFKEESFYCELMLKYIRGLVTAREVWLTYARDNNIRLPRLTEDISEILIESVVEESFTESDPASSNNKASDLGDLAVRLVEFLTGHEDPRAMSCLFSGVPLLQSYGIIEEMYLDLRKSAISLRENHEKWPLFLRTMAIPWDDKVFVQRQSHSVAATSTLFGKKLRERHPYLLNLAG